MATRDANSPDASEGVDQQLLDRLRLGIWLDLAGIAIVFVGELALRPGERPLVSVVQAVNFAAAAAGLRILQDPARRAFNCAVGFLLFVVTVVAVGAVGVVAADATTPVVLMVCLAVASATLVPWNPWWQLLCVASVVGTAIWTVTSIVASPHRFWVQYVGSIAPTLLSTVVISYALARQRAAEASVERERRRREGSLLDANQRLEREIEEHRKTEEVLRFAMLELDHRVKNTLATVHAIAEQTLHSSRSMAEFGQAFRGRIQALARIHRALSARRLSELPLTELIELVVGPYRPRADSVAIDCNGTFISPELVRALGLALHELATNAAKYGALSTKEGQVTVSSHSDAGEPARLRIRWSEQFGPPVRAPERKGFGMKLIEEALAYETDGKVTLQFPPQGLCCEIEVPAHETRV